MLPQKLHFVGVAGVGMSALAQLRALAGDSVGGSDRLADKDGLGDLGRRLESAGIKLFRQDGGGVDAALDRVIASTAIEDDNADLARARALGRPIVHRADELAALAASRRAVAVAGTSGKSTVTAMIFHALEACGRGPSLAAGAYLPSLRRKGLLGNAWSGASDLLVLEADESDGTLTRYAPSLGVLLNVSKDHKEPAELLELFRIFRRNSERLVVNADAPGLAEFEPGGLTFGFEAGTLRGRSLELAPDAVSFAVDGVRFKLPAPGRHNAENALAAAAACLELGVPLAETAAALESYETIGRRFEVVGRARGVEVVDDYAHNPEKLRAVFAAARLRSKRVLAVFQLHGFGPARFMKAELLGAFRDVLGPEDALWLPDIYYAGGTTAKDISARDYADALAASGLRARHVPSRPAIVEEIAREARPGDLVLVLGARDATLSDLAASILKAL